MWAGIWWVKRLSPPETDAEVTRCTTALIWILVEALSRLWPICHMSGNVLLETSLGQIELELYWDHAPKVCNQTNTPMSREGWSLKADIALRHARTSWSSPRVATITVSCFIVSSPSATYLHSIIQCILTKKWSGLHGSRRWSDWHRDRKSVV